MATPLSTPGGGGLEANIMAALAFLDSDSIEQDHLLERNTSFPSMPASSFTIPFDLIQGEENNGSAALLKDHTANAAAASPPHLSRTSRTEYLSSCSEKENGQSTNKQLFVDIDSHYKDSEDECANVCRLVSPRRNTSSKRHRATHVCRLVSPRSNTSSKQHRATHVHNLSERTDKASILEEAIQYVKQLQLQVQMLSSPSKMNPSHSCVPVGIPCFQMPQMCMNMNLGSMGMGINMAHSHSQWNNGFMIVPQGVQGQTILPWANEQNKE